MTQLTENLISGREMEEKLLMEDQQQEKQNESIKPKHLVPDLLCSGTKDTVDYRCNQRFVGPTEDFQIPMQHSSM